MFGYTMPKPRVNYWGARAIYNGHPYYNVDLLCDRQSCEGEPGDSQKAFMRWVNKVGLPWLRKEVKRIGMTTYDHTELIFADDRYQLRATCNGSYGYLYIGAAEYEPILERSE